MYSNLPNLILAFHGCDKTTFNNVIYKHQELHPSQNPYDWLGNGIYLWENSIARAYEWAQFYCDRYNRNHPGEEQKEPAVIGMVVCLGHCLDLTDYSSAEILRNGYEILKCELEAVGKSLPINKNVRGNNDLLLRELDCAIIERIHQFNREKGKLEYDSVRGLFTEGKPVYDNSGIMEKTLVQLCIRNTNCIKGYFRPKTADTKWRSV